MLRKYQEELIGALRKAQQKEKRVVAVLPTGGGKTFIFCNIAKGALERGNKVLILTDRIELLKQAGGALQKFNLKPTELKAGKTPYLGDDLYVSMIETLYRRIKKPEYQHFLKGFRVIIIDEAHMRNFDKLFPYFGADSKIIGFTATPTRQGKKGMMGDHYTGLVVGAEIDYLIREGYLSAPKYFGVPLDLTGIRKVGGEYDSKAVAKRFSEQKQYKGVVDNYERYAAGKKALVFCSTIESSKELLREFRDYDARHLDSYMSDTEREEILRWFAQPGQRILCNVGILTKGFDQPDIECVVLYRATTSRALYMQMIGRGSRTTETKDEFTILDFGSNVQRFGYWHEKYEWTLDREDPNEKKGAQPCKACPKCKAIIPVQTLDCPYCEHEFIQEKKERHYVLLKQMNPKELWNYSKKQKLEKRAEMSKRGLLKPQRVLHELTDLDEVYRFVELMGWSQGWLYVNHHRYNWSAQYLERQNTGIITLRK